MVAKTAAQKQPAPTTNGTTNGAASRMSLSALIKGRQERPLRALLYGVEGVGKSTFGAAAPDAIFLGAEEISRPERMTSPPRSRSKRYQ